MSEGINIACRTCMRTNQTYIGILEHYECSKLLAEMLTECTTVKVEPFDDLPKFMCNNCTEKLISSWNFKSMALNADEKFRSSSNGDKRLPATALEIENDGIVVYDDTISIKEEEITVKVEESDLFTVNYDICDDKLDELIEKPNLLVTERVGCDLTEIKDDDSSSKDPIITNEAAEDILENESEIADEYNIQKDFPMPKDAQKLTKEEHNKTPVFCKICNRSFPLKIYKIHRRQHIGDTPHKCDICGEAFVLLHQLKAHQATHEIDEAHVARHRKENKFICEICGKSFLDSSAFSSHRLYLHADVKKHSCPTCGKMFTTMSQVRAHERQVHLDHRPYACDYCGKRFKVSNALKSHMRIHTGEKPYSCNVCGKQFRQRSCLPGHMRLHTGETPFCCEKCPAKFKHLHLLKNHSKVHTS